MTQNLLLGSVSLALAAGASEAILRLGYPAPAPSIEPQTRVLESPLLGWVLPAGSQSYAFDVPVSINSLGMRDDEFPRAKPPGETRVLGLGDSFTFGPGVRFEDLYLQRLERRLNGSNGPKRFQVMNAGVGGYNTRQELIYLLTEGFSVEPDLITVGFYWNDLLGNQEALPDLASTARVSPDARKWQSGEGERRDLIPKKVRYHLRRSLLLYLSLRAVKNLIAALLPDLNELTHAQRALLVGGEAFLEPYWEATGARLLEIAEAARRRSIPVVLLIFPMEDQIRHHYPRMVFAERLRAIWAPTRMPVIDLEPAYRSALDAGENPFLPYELHPNDVGMRLAADALFETLSREHLLGTTGSARRIRDGLLQQ